MPLKLVAPAFRWDPEGAPMIFPFLFITIACGAISGFHGLVASGTTANVVSDGSNVVQDDTCNPTVSDHITADAGLGPLADNGGPTLTHALVVGSVAVDVTDTGDASVGDRQVADPSGCPGAVDDRAADHLQVVIHRVFFSLISALGRGHLRRIDADIADPLPPAVRPLDADGVAVGGTVAGTAAPDSAIVNEVQVRWDNDILGPDFPISAGAAIPVVAAVTTTTTPGGSTGKTAGPGSGSEGAPLSVVG